MAGIIRRLRKTQAELRTFARHHSYAQVLPAFARGFSYGARPDLDHATATPELQPEPNPLRDFFENRTEGPGIWKWEHYFDTYHRHFARFVGRPVDIMEIGIYSGGSLDMWASYFGDGCHVYGVDIEPSCKAYERDNVSILIGDQSNRQFWAQARSELGGLDILVDDGSHDPAKQIVALEEMLPYLRPGGVYVCEDVHGTLNDLLLFASGLVGRLNAFDWSQGSAHAGTPTTPMQRTVHSIHFYPFMIVLEKVAVPQAALSAPRHGSEWNPALYQ